MPAHLQRADGPGFPPVLTPGVYFPPSSTLDSHLALEAAPGPTVHAMLLTNRALGGFPAVLRGIDTDGLGSTALTIGTDPRTELIWVAKADRVDAPLEPLMHVLGEAVATDPHADPVAIVRSRRCASSR